MFLHAFVVYAIAQPILYIYNYIHYLNQTAEFERKRQKRRAGIKQWKLKNKVKCSTETSCCKSLRGRSSKYEPHGGWNFATTPTDQENMAESFQNSQLNSTQASETKKRIRENS